MFSLSSSSIFTPTKTNLLIRELNSFKWSSIVGPPILRWKRYFFEKNLFVVNLISYRFPSFSQRGSTVFSSITLNTTKFSRQRRIVEIVFLSSFIQSSSVMSLVFSQPLSRLGLGHFEPTNPLISSSIGGNYLRQPSQSWT